MARSMRRIAAAAAASSFAAAVSGGGTVAGTVRGDAPLTQRRPPSSAFDAALEATRRMSLAESSGAGAGPGSELPPPRPRLPQHRTLQGGSATDPLEGVATDETLFSSVPVVTSAEGDGGGAGDGGIDGGGGGGGIDGGADGTGGGMDMVQVDPFPGDGAAGGGGTTTTTGGGGGNSSVDGGPGGGPGGPGADPSLAPEAGPVGDGDAASASSQAQTDQVTAAPSGPSWEPGCPSSTTTPYDDTNGSYGNVFHVRTPRPTSNNGWGATGSSAWSSKEGNDVWITGMDFYTDLETEVSYEVWTMQGIYYYDFTGMDDLPLGDLTRWTLVANGTATGGGRGKGTSIPDEEFTPVKIPAGGRARSFYVTLTTADIRYTSGEGANLLLPDAGNDNDSSAGNLPPDDAPYSYEEGDGLILYEGVGVLTYPFSSSKYDYSSSPRLFLGSLRYEEEGATCPPTPSPTSELRPTEFPTARPSPPLPPTDSPVASTPVDGLGDGNSPTDWNDGGNDPTYDPNELLTTRVLYEFYVTHSSALDEAAYTREVESMVLDALDALIEEAGTELYDRAVQDGMVALEAEAYLAGGKDEPECDPPDPVAQTCSTIAVSVTVEHRASATRDDVRRALFLYGPDVAAALGLPVVDASYTGVRALTSEMIIGLEGFEIEVDEEGGVRVRGRRLQDDGEELVFGEDGVDEDLGGVQAMSSSLSNNTAEESAVYTEGLMGRRETDTFTGAVEKFLRQRLQSEGVDVTGAKVDGQKWVLVEGEGANDTSGGGNGWDEDTYYYDSTVSNGDGSDYGDTVEAANDGVVIPGDQDGFNSGTSGQAPEGGLFIETEMREKDGGTATSAASSAEREDATFGNRRLRLNTGRPPHRIDFRKSRRANGRRRLPRNSLATLEVTTTITGEYRPPPARDLDELVEDSIDKEPDKFVGALKTASPDVDFFDDVTGVKTRQVDGGSEERDKGETSAPTASPPVAATKSSGNGGGGGGTTKTVIVAATVSVVAVVLCAVGFVFFRFRRRRVSEEEEMDITELMAKQQAKQNGGSVSAVGSGKYPPQEAFQNSGAAGAYDELGQAAGEPGFRGGDGYGDEGDDGYGGHDPQHQEQYQQGQGGARSSCEKSVGGLSMGAMSMGSVPTVQMSNTARGRQDRVAAGAGQRSLDGVSEYEEGGAYGDDDAYENNAYGNDAYGDGQYGNDQYGNGQYGDEAYGDDQEEDEYDDFQEEDEGGGDQDYPLGSGPGPMDSSANLGAGAGGGSRRGSGLRRGSSFFRKAASFRGGIGGVGGRRRSGATASSTDDGTGGGGDLEDVPIDNGHDSYGGGQQSQRRFEGEEALHYRALDDPTRL